MKNKIGTRWGAFFVSILPAGVLIIVIYIIYKKITSGKSIVDTIKDSVGLKQGSDTTIEQNKKQVELIKETTAKQGRQPNASHIAAANQIFNLINELGFYMVNPEISKEAQTKVYAVLNAQKYTADVAMIIVSYGTRTANNRQHPLGGFIWDETNGTLADHVNRYFNDTPEKKTIQEWIRKAYTYYLNG